MIIDEAKNEMAIQDDVDSRMDEILDNAGTSVESSTTGEKDTVDNDDDGAGTVQPKKTDETVNPDKTALSKEEKLAKIKEILGDDAEAIHAYIKEHGYHKDPAWQKLMEGKKKELEGLPSKEELELFKETTSSPEYIRASMMKKGFTEEAINGELQKRGFEVPEQDMDELQFLANKFGFNPNNVDEVTRNQLSDMAKIAKAIVEHTLETRLPKELQPIKQTIQSEQQAKSGQAMIKSLNDMVENPGKGLTKVLDFKKDIEPELHKFIDENPRCIQSDIYNFGKQVIYEKTIERLAMVKKQEERNVKKEVLNRQNTKTISKLKAPLEMTGDKDADMDAILDALDYRE